MLKDIQKDTTSEAKGTASEAIGPAVLSRPNFFPGQLLDYRDFNRLAEQGPGNVAMLSSRLLNGGGILLQTSREFELVPAGNLNLTVKPGMALLPSGDLLVLGEDLALDLSQYQKGSNQRLVVGIRQKPVALDPYTDPEDPSIQGFRTRAQMPELVVVADTLPSECLELFRVILGAESTALRNSSESENWNTGEIEPQAGEAILDARFRRNIVPLTFAPLDFSGLLGMRNALYAVEDAHRRLQRIFLIRDDFDTHTYLTGLHAELLSVPYQPLKVAFLVAAFSEKLSLFLESIYRKCQADQPNFNRDLYFQIATILDEARARQAIPRALPFEPLRQMATLLEAFTQFAEQRFALINAVEEALGDLKDRVIPFPEKTTLAGHLFRRVDYLAASDKDRVAFQGSQNQVRKLQTRYRNGDQIARTGVFVRDGKISIDFQVPNPDSPAVIWFPQYVRRKGAKLEYRVNGKTLLRESSAEPDSDNLWKNRGLVIQPEALVPQGNRLTIRVDEADLDYGFFEAAVYQPVVGGAK